jgi:uncharacterized RDD family membrane protein YckC
MTMSPRSEYAGFWQRLAAFLINLFLFAIVTSLVPLMVFRLSGGAVDLLVVEGMSSWLFLVALVVCWHRFQGSPGQLMMGCYVVDEQGRAPIDLKTATVRGLGYILSGIPLALGFLWVAWDKRKQGWHDKLAGTLVIQDRHHDVSDESQKSLEQLLKELR